MISKYASVEQIDDDLYAIFNRLDNNYKFIFDILYFEVPLLCRFGTFSVRYNTA